MEHETREPKVTFEFDFYEHQNEIKQIVNYADAYCSLNEIYQMVRDELKHGNEPLSQHIETLLERIKEEAWVE